MRQKRSSLGLTLLYGFVHLLLALTSYLVVKMLYDFFKNLHRIPIQSNLVSKGDAYFVFWFAFLCLIVSIITLLYFRKFIRNIKHGETFTQKNIQILKKFSWGLLAICVLTMIQKGAYYVVYVIPTGAPDPSYSFNAWLLILALVMWGMIHVFSSGHKLQQENDLTV